MQLCDLKLLSDHVQYFFKYIYKLSKYLILFFICKKKYNFLCLLKSKKIFKIHFSNTLVLIIFAAMFLSCYYQSSTLVVVCTIVLATSKVNNNNHQCPIPDMLSTINFFFRTPEEEALVFQKVQLRIQKVHTQI